MRRFTFTPEVLAAIRHDRYHHPHPRVQQNNVLAALNAVTHEILRVANHSYINAESVCALLRQIASAGLPRPITLVLDNARYQRCALVQALARSLHIELLFLPSYSPNLNLIERLWKFLKKECLASRPLPDYETFTRTIDDDLNCLRTKYKRQMATLLTLNFQTYEDEPVLATYYLGSKDPQARSG